MVQKGDIIEVKKQDVEVGKKMSVEAMLVSDLDGKETKIGTPMVAGSKVEFKVLDDFEASRNAFKADEVNLLWSTIDAFPTEVGGLSDFDPVIVNPFCCILSNPRATSVVPNCHRTSIHVGMPSS